MAARKPVSAGTIVLRDIDGQLKVALAHHKRGSHKRPWVLPKGHVEPGETFEEAALRETHEEAGLDNVQLIKYLGTITREIEVGGEALQKTIHYYLAYSSANAHVEVPTDPRFVEAGWFTPEQMLKKLAPSEEKEFVMEHLDSLLKRKRK